MVAPKTQKRTLLNGLNPLAYQGVEPSSPAAYVTDVRDPISGTSKDYQGFDVGDEWENRLTHAVWKLVSKDNGVATWVLAIGTAGNVTNLIDDSGDVILPNSTGGITVTGGLDIYTDSPAANTIGINLTQGIQSGEILISNTATGEAEWNRITPGAGITVTNAQGHITISSAGFGGDVTLIGDDGTTATTVAGSVNVIANQATVDCGASVLFTGDLANTFSLNVTDVNANTLVGKLAGNTTLTGDENTGLGEGALAKLTTGARNCGLGELALANLTTGNDNTSLGAGAGVDAVTGSSNIYINHPGVAAEDGFLRIGDPAIAVYTLNATYIDGIYQKAISATFEDVRIDSNGKLGTSPYIYLGASSGAEVNNVTGDGTSYRPIISGVVTNPGGGYDALTGLFTAPVTGQYHVDVLLHIANIGAGHTDLSLRLLINGGAGIFLQELNPAVIRTTTNNIVAGGSTTTTLAAGSTLEIQLIVSNSTKTISTGGAGLSTFRLFLVH